VFQTAIKISNLPLFVNNEQLKTAFNTLFDNQVHQAGILLDIADHSTGVGYIVFETPEKRNDCLTQSEQTRFIFLE